jgi:hypothetical protein
MSAAFEAFLAVLLATALLTFINIKAVSDLVKMITFILIMLGAGTLVGIAISLVFRV